MRLSTRSLLALFAVGAACGLIGDHAHVESGATRYLDVGGVPMIWGSPLFFMISVGLATAVLAEIGLRLGGPRAGIGWDGLAAAASVLAIYLVTAVLADESTSTVTALIACLAALVLVRFGENRRGGDRLRSARRDRRSPGRDRRAARRHLRVHRQRRRPLGRRALAGTALLRLRSRRRPARRAAGGGAGGRGLSENPRVSDPEHSRPPSFLRATIKEQVRLFSIRPRRARRAALAGRALVDGHGRPRVGAAVRGRRADRLGILLLIGATGVAIGVVAWYWRSRSSCRGPPHLPRRTAASPRSSGARGHRARPRTGPKVPRAAISSSRRWPSSPAGSSAPAGSSSPRSTGRGCGSTSTAPPTTTPTTTSLHPGGDPGPRRRLARRLAATSRGSRCSTTSPRSAGSASTSTTG